MKDSRVIRHCKFNSIHTILNSVFNRQDMLFVVYRSKSECNPCNPIIPARLHPRTGVLSSCPFLSIGQTIIHHIPVSYLQAPNPSYSHLFLTTPVNLGSSCKYLSRYHSVLHRHQRPEFPYWASSNTPVVFLEDRWSNTMRCDVGISIQ